MDTPSFKVKSNPATGNILSNSIAKTVISTPVTSKATLKIPAANLILLNFIDRLLLNYLSHL